MARRALTAHNQQSKSNGPHSLLVTLSRGPWVTTTTLLTFLLPCFLPSSVCQDSIGLHRVENVSHTEPAVSLHLYSPPFDTCHAFDQRTGHKNRVTMTFHSKFGIRTPFVSTVSCVQTTWEEVREMVPELWQRPHGGPTPPLTPFLGDLMPMST